MLMKRIYLDHASLTPIDKEVFQEIQKYSKGEFANPSAIYKEGVKAKRVVDDARKKIAGFLSAHGDEIFFTSGGTEANNLVIIGIFEAEIKKGKKPQDIHIVTSKIEHASILEPIRLLESLGAKVDYIGVDKEGIVDFKELKEKICKETILVSIMYVNNEIGTIQPIREIAKIIRDFRKTNTLLARPFFHTDACQAPLYIKLDVEKLGVDLMTIDGQKMNGPRGVGAFYKKKNVELAPLIFGGGQERGLRSGTENVAGIAGFAKAFDLVEKRMAKDTKTVNEIRNYFISKLKSEIFPKVPGAVINGSETKRTPNNVNISLPGIDNEFVLLTLDARGVACSTKSSCLRDEDESYVISALGVSKNIAKSSIRFSLGRDSSIKDIDYVIKVLKSIF